MDTLAQKLESLSGMEIVYGIIGYAQLGRLVSATVIVNAVAEAVDGCVAPTQLSQCRQHRHYHVEGALDRLVGSNLLPSDPELTTDRFIVTASTQAALRTAVDTADDIFPFGHAGLRELAAIVSNKIAQ